MPEIHSPFAHRYEPGRHPAEAEPCLSIRELVGWDLVQVAAWRGRVDALAERVGRALGVSPPQAPGRCAAADGIELLSVAPLRWWCIAPLGDARLAAVSDAVDADAGCVTRLGHSHVRARISGPATRRLLAQEVAIDLDPDPFPAGTIARTSFHHVPAMLQCIDAAAEIPTFDLYLTRTFAESTWEYLLDLAEAHGYEILERTAVGS